MKYWDIFIRSFGDYWHYLQNAITHPSWENYFYWLIGVSLFFFMLEYLRPWHRNQKLIRRDFWLDAFYMFFNFFLFSLIGFAAISNIATTAFDDLLSQAGLENIVAIQLNTLPVWLQFAILFIYVDFLSWCIHYLLHHHQRLWQFHKVHHSVKEMGFAAQMRYHWIENIVYSTLKYIPVAIIGFSIQDYFLIHIISFGIGHFNHSNFDFSLGPLKYIFNNPKMHIWHHARELPNPYGVNFGISLSIWDYLFHTNYIPRDGHDIELGFAGDEQFPKKFIYQNLYGFKKA